MPDQIRRWWSDYLEFQNERMLDTIDFIDSNSKILEVGCAPGQLLFLLDRLGYRVSGVDVDPDRLCNFWRKHNLQIQKVDIEKDLLPFDNEAFDTVLLLQVLEHLRVNPLGAIRELYRILRPGGEIIVSVPNITPLHRLRFFLGKSYLDHPLEAFAKLEWLGHAGHVRLYSKEELIDVLKAIGFTDCQSHYRGKYPTGWKPKLYMAIHRSKETFREDLFVIAKKPLRAETPQ